MRMLILLIELIIRYYEDDLHYNSLRVKEGYKAIDFDEAMEKVNPEDAEEPSLQVRMKRT